MMKFREIPRLPSADYSVHVPWDDLEKMLDRYKSMNLDMNPDFQRGCVWSEYQKSAYVEWVLRGGESGLDIYFNHPGWMTSFKGEFVLLDGKQRLSSALGFLHNEVRAFGLLFSEFEGKLPSYIQFKFNILNLKNRASVLRWYLAYNTGGSVHAKEEIARVKSLLEKEDKNG